MSLCCPSLSIRLYIQEDHYSRIYRNQNLVRYLPTDMRPYITRAFLYKEYFIAVSVCQEPAKAIPNFNFFHTSVSYLHSALFKTLVTKSSIFLWNPPQCASSSRTWTVFMSLLFLCYCLYFCFMFVYFGLFVVLYPYLCLWLV